jgi:NAD(P)-dependent dehydrogenase (short-subunit alcohol dehydrogenase family)
MKEHTVFVSGASGGIGSAIAEAFIRNGYKTILHYHANKDTVTELKTRLEKEGYNDIYCMQADLQDSASVDSLVKTIESNNLTVDVLINNAGIKHDSPTESLSDSDFENVLRTNVLGTFMITKRLFPAMKQKGYGRIVNISSGVAQHGRKNGANYGASKAAVENMTKSWAQEFGPYGVTVNTVAPGLIETDMTKDVDEDTKTAYVKKIPLGKLAKPEDVAYACLFFADEKSQMISQQVIGVNGGLR